MLNIYSLRMDDIMTIGAQKTSHCHRWGERGASWRCQTLLWIHWHPMRRFHSRRRLRKAPCLSHPGLRRQQLNSR